MGQAGLESEGMDDLHIFFEDGSDLLVLLHSGQASEESGLDDDAVVLAAAGGGVGHLDLLGVELCHETSHDVDFALGTVGEESPGGAEETEESRHIISLY